MKTIIRLLVVVIACVLARAFVQSMFANAVASHRATNTLQQTKKERPTSQIEGTPIVITAPGAFLAKVSTMKQKIGDERIVSVREFSMETSRQDFLCNILISTYAPSVNVSLQGGAEGAISKLKATFDTIKNQSIQDITIGNKPAKLVTVNGAVSSYNLVSKGVIFDFKGKAAAVMVVYNEANPTYHDEADRIISSIRLRM